MDGKPIRSAKVTWPGIWFCLAAFVLVASGSAPATAAEPDECADPQAQQQMNYCIAQEYWKLDGELAKAYEAALAYTRKMDQVVPPPGGPDRKTETQALTMAETAWVQYRDAHCDGMGYKARGGTLEPLLVGNCKVELTRNRIKELEDITTSLED